MLVGISEMIKQVVSRAIQFSTVRHLTSFEGVHSASKGHLSFSHSR